ncbi:response regulator [Micromonospora eburnea]|uniref:Two component transcriptional regulator, LuxR family n=1 Tax=Micromonospora eburnea TaxID=227316 RepID=A0A1C6VEF2_9ACTN|nr:response regulator transcription factor [Micromonospora eburnea]SCL64507.1 two component transcriptional regulator, LuxR family [Micromonospora eburnea]
MRVIIAEDAPILREGLVRLLADAGCTIVGQTDHGPGLVALTAEHQPDVIIVDIRLPPTHTDEGLRAALRVRQDHPAIGVLLLSQYVESSSAVQVLAREPRGFGYLLKERLADVEELVAALRRVAAGESVIDPLVVERLLSRRRVASALDELTRREREVLTLMAEGRSNEAIAQRLGVGGKTVETYVRNIFAKLCLEPRLADHRRVLAVLAYLQG